MLALPSGDVTIIAISVRDPVNLTGADEADTAATPFAVRLLYREDVATGFTRISAV
ncbi:hypothetical protein SBA3_3490021 [Candidatus Sulfopaludibacter sp. SbA3]|nr:hypothetical protein SBA3_3490021 [Candidatus Sulfopaludibacter sp. SbA3]